MTQAHAIPVSRIGLVLALVLTMAFGLSIAARQAPATARAALFTDAQAAGGEALYRQSCAGCHGASLTGGIAPALAGPAFEASWSDPRVTLADIFFIARTTMPPRASGSLSPQDHAAVFAFILKSNGFPAGPTALTAASEQLEAAHLRSAGVPAAARPVPPAFVPGAAGAVPAAGGPDQATLSGSAQSTDWLFHTHDYSGTRFSPLQEINTTTASRLAPACLSRSASGITSRPDRSCTRARCS
jgi:mono/diheme cytochrome c family protein